LAQESAESWASLTTWPQGGTKWPQSGTKWPQSGTKWPQSGPKWPQSGTLRKAAHVQSITLHPHGGHAAAEWHQVAAEWSQVAAEWHSAETGFCAEYHSAPT